ncbi:hypothetical protein [Sporolactobacillus vineae]|uniref:hypothetical protein n=1 Tax=Sporolactobacillus vineae TaxID=444463 RepID=UPI0002881DC3|nr:hypothetical protein [Sporolactobacillus vineae]
MLTVFLYLSYFALLLVFFISVFFRIDVLSALLMYAVIAWLCIVPLIVIYIDAAKYEQKKSRIEKKKNNMN